MDPCGEKKDSLVAIIVANVALQIVYSICRIAFFLLTIVILGGFWATIYAPFQGDAVSV